MFRPRVIPALLLQGRGLVKTTRFRKKRYVGDPINAVRIFSELRADELLLLDINATNKGRTFSVELVERVGGEAGMPFGVGGGIRSVGEARALLRAGAEKIVLSSGFFARPALARECADTFGSQAVVVCIDVRHTLLGGFRTYTHNGRRRLGLALFEAAQLAESQGAGEIIVQSIRKDGTMSGYDLEAIRIVASATTVPVIALGGAGSTADMKDAFSTACATAMSAGSMFVFHGPRRAVLISYPRRRELFNGEQ